LNGGTIYSNGSKKHGAEVA